MKRNQSHCSRVVVPLRRSIGLALWLGVVCTVLLVSRHAQAADPEFDIIIRKGRIVDGTGNPAIHADLAIKGGRIAAIGKVAGTAKQELDAEGLVVAPGFIDVHTHAEDIDDQPLGENFLRMGVTTIMLGNCGASALNIGDYFRALEITTTSPNVATLVGHSTVRRRAMHGSFDRPPTPEELEEMKATVRRGMEEGAFGISTGLIYLPGVFAKTEEIIALAQVAAEFDGIYATHQRSEGDNIRTSLDEIFRIAREARIRAEISHLKLSGPSSWHQAKEILGIIDQARASGLDITQDQYAYTASSTGISQLIPEWMREGGQERFLQRMAEPETKAKLVAEMKDKLQKRKSPDYSYAVIAAYRPNPCLNGMSIVEATKLNRPTDSIDDQVEMILEIESNGGASGIFHGMSEEDIQEFMRHPNTMIACDSGVRRFQVDVPHPRGYGNNARVLGQYVREKKVLRLEDAIRKMSSLPARTFRIKERGELHEGWWADLAIFDAEKVSDPSTFADPHHYSTGFRYVLVNGAVVIDNDRHNGARPGKVLRHMDRGIPSETAPTPVTPAAAVPAQ